MDVRIKEETDDYSDNYNYLDNCDYSNTYCMESNTYCMKNSVPSECSNRTENICEWYSNGGYKKTGVQMEGVQFESYFTQPFCKSRIEFNSNTEISQEHEHIGNLNEDIQSNKNAKSLRNRPGAYSANFSKSAVAVQQNKFIKEETLDEYEYENIIPADSGKQQEQQNVCDKVKQEVEVDIVKEEIDDASSVQTGFENDLETFDETGFAFPIIKAEDRNVESVSELSSFHESDIDDDVSDNVQFTARLKEKAKILFQALMDCTTDDGRRLILPFLENPMKEFQPHYYKIISDPVDMKMIRDKIKRDSYKSLKEVRLDFMLMLQNAQMYHNAESQVYIDAEILSGVFHEKLQEIKQISSHQIPKNVLKKMKSLYNAVRNHRDENQRRLSSSFVKLPSKLQFPDYYEFIRKPIDLEIIQRRMKLGHYLSVKSLFDDLTLLFLNGCLYYEPQSQIYRIALMLQNVAIKKYLEIVQKDEASLDAGEIVQNMIVSLFNRVFNLKTSKGKYLSNSFARLPVYEELDGKKCRIMSFDVMKHQLDRGFYTRLDQFQNDLFTVFEKARSYTSVNSRLYSDAITMQKEYLTIRDEIFRHGSLALLKTRALDFREEDLLRIYEKRKKGSKADGSEYDASDGEPKLQTLKSAKQPDADEEPLHIECCLGDFIYYISPSEDSSGPDRICHVIDITTDSRNRKVIRGCQYYRPEETYFNSSKMFYEQEIFKTEKRINVLESQVFGKCVVLLKNDYVAKRVEDFDEEDVYVCMSQYNYRQKRFSKLKNLMCDLPSEVKLVDREKPLEMRFRHVASFSRGVEQRRNLFTELEEEANTSAVYFAHQNILKPLDKTKDGHLFFVQYSTPFGLIKLGDFVYIQGSGQKSILHVSRIFTTKENKEFIVGLRYVLGSDIPISVKGRQLEYRKEVYFTATQETHSLEDVTGRCSIFTMKEYTSKRCTEIPEKDVFLCKSHYNEEQQTILPLQSGILKYSLPCTVLADEIYFFIKPLNPNKIEKSYKWSSRSKTGRPTKKSGIVLKTKIMTQDGDRTQIKKAPDKKAAFHKKQLGSKKTASVLKSSKPAGVKSGPLRNLDKRKKQSILKVRKNPPKFSERQKYCKVQKNVVASAAAAKIPVRQVGVKKSVRAFIHFSVYRRKELMNTLSTASFSKLSSLLVKEWLKLSLKEKIRYETLTLKMKCKNLGDIKLEQLKGYALFCSEMRRIARINFPNAKIGKVTHLLKVEWLHMDDSDRTLFQNIATMWAISDDEEPDFIGFPDVVRKPADIRADDLASVKCQSNESESKIEVSDFSISPSPTASLVDKSNQKNCDTVESPYLSKDSVDRSGQENCDTVESPYQSKDSVDRPGQENCITLDSLHKSTDSIDKSVVSSDSLILPNVHWGVGEVKNSDSSVSFNELLHSVSDLEKDEPSGSFCQSPYSHYGLQKCFVSLKPLHIPLESKRSFMINDGDGGFVFLIHPSDHLKYIKERLKFDPEESVPVTVEKNSSVSKEDRPFLCDKCGKCYREKGTLINHMKKHGSQKNPFRCRRCTPRAQFNNKSSLLNHMVLWHGKANVKIEIDSEVLTDDLLNLSVTSAAASPLIQGNEYSLPKETVSAAEEDSIQEKIGIEDSIQEKIGIEPYSCDVFVTDQITETYNKNNNLSISDMLSFPTCHSATTPESICSSYVSPSNCPSPSQKLSKRSVSSPSSVDNIFMNSISSKLFIPRVTSGDSRPVSPIVADNIVFASFPTPTESCSEDSVNIHSSPTGDVVIDGLFDHIPNEPSSVEAIMVDYSLSHISDSIPHRPSFESDCHDAINIISVPINSNSRHSVSAEYLRVNSSSPNNSSANLQIPTIIATDVTPVVYSNIVSDSSASTLDVNCSSVLSQASHESLHVSQSNSNINSASHGGHNSTEKLFSSCRRLSSEEDDFGNFVTVIAVSDVAKPFVDSALYTENQSMYATCQDEEVDQQNGHQPTMHLRHTVRDEQKPYHRTKDYRGRGSKYSVATFPCSKCPKVFTKKSEYNKHFFEHSESATKSFKCCICSVIFSVVFSKESYSVWKRKKSQPVCSGCQPP